MQVKEWGFFWLFFLIRGWQFYCLNVQCESVNPTAQKVAAFDFHSTQGMLPSSNSPSTSEDYPFTATLRIVLSVVLLCFPSDLSLIRCRIRGYGKNSSYDGRSSSREGRSPSTFTKENISSYTCFDTRC